MNILYTPSYFRDSFPVWKRKKDPLFLKYFVRPLSFYGASFCAKCGIQANTVSYVSGIVALVACSFFLLPYHVCHIIAAGLFTIWIYMDCIDGNLARSVKKQPFGIFADAISSYMLVGFMDVCVITFRQGGVSSSSALKIERERKELVLRKGGSIFAANIYIGYYRIRY